LTTRTRLIIACLFVLALTGCAATSVKKDFSFQNEPDKGLVVFSVSHDLEGSGSTRAIFYMDGGTSGGGTMVKSIEEVIPGFFDGSRFEDSFGHVLAIALPAGKHTIDDWQITDNALRVRAKQKPTALVFEVEKGKVKYIGNLHAKIAEGSFLGIIAGGYPEIRDRRERDIPIFEEKYAQFKGKVLVETLPLGPWVPLQETRRQFDPVIVPGPYKK
jgi:hypothetical protein